MNLLIESMRKLMGWCPNAKITDPDSGVSPANFAAYDRSGGEKANRSGKEKAQSKLSLMKRIGLLLASIGAFVSALTLDMEKDNISLLMVGVGTLLFLIGIILYIRS
jgi:hypothetical protein